MKSTLYDAILKELGHFNFKEYELSKIMSELYNNIINIIKNQLLSFLIEHRGKVITIPMIFKILKKLRV